MKENVGTYFRVYLGKDKLPSALDNQLESSQRASRFSLDEVTTGTRKLSLCSTEPRSMEGLSLRQSKDRTSKSIHFETKETNTIEIMGEDGSILTKKSSLDIQPEMIAESLEAMYAKLEKIEQTNTTRFKKNYRKK